MNFIERALLSRKYIVYKAEKKAKCSYSQSGEDLVLRHWLFIYCDLVEITYLDIGSAHPIFLSNTYYFYKEGFNGVCVDANPSLTDKYKLMRPRDTFFNYGITTSNEAEKDFYVMNIAELNTFDKEEVEKLVNKYGFEIEKVIKVQTKSINSIIKEYCKSAPDLLSIDIEGLDFAVLKSLDYEKYRPKLIIVEIASYDQLRHVDGIKETEFMEEKGYRSLGRVGYSIVFIDNNL